MTRKPSAAPPDQPVLPPSGGAWVVQPDGELTRTESTTNHGDEAASKPVETPLEPASKEA